MKWATIILICTKMTLGTFFIASTWATWRKLWLNCYCCLCYLSWISFRPVYLYCKELGALINNGLHCLIIEMVYNQGKVT
jgi:hypothetical protein